MGQSVPRWVSRQREYLIPDLIEQVHVDATRRVLDDVVARLFHAPSLLREQCGDGHIAAADGRGGRRPRGAYMLFALDMDRWRRSSDASTTFRRRSSSP